MASISFGGYAFAVEPIRLVIQRYNVLPPNWPRGLRLRAAVLADIHASHPWMGPERIRHIVTKTHELEPDIIFLLGDYVGTHGPMMERVSPEVWAGALEGLSAPLGVHAILGNHDWWADWEAQKRGGGPIFSQRALEDAGIPVYENDAVKLSKDGHDFWVAGLGDQEALLPGGRWSRRRRIGVDDLPATLEKITDDAPILLLAHEPDIFVKVPERVSLTLAGHTHGGQVRILGYAPALPSRLSRRYLYGHFAEAGNDGTERHLIVSGGLGCSILPVRFGVPPEIVVVDLGAGAASA